MGTVIDRTCLTTGSWRSRHSALRLAVSAARTCLEEAGTSPDDLDLLVNTGLYRDRNLGEPALAALIQEDIGANPEDPHPDAHGTFSFDVANGVCGPLTALQIIDGFLGSGTIQHALVVASDADPGHGQSVDFPFSAVGGALLCSHVEGDAGLGPVTWGSFPDGGESFRATVAYREGRNLLEIAVSETIDQSSATAAAKVVADCLERASTSLDGIDRIVAAPARPGFVSALAEHLGVAPARFAVAPDSRTHTAALIGALHDAALEPGSRALLVAVGAGLTAGAAIYRVPA